MIAANCVIPILVPVFFVWLMNVILGVAIKTPRWAGRSKLLPHVAAKKWVGGGVSPQEKSGCGTVFFALWGNLGKNDRLWSTGCNILQKASTSRASA
jgi:hypothetical protein